MVQKRARERWCQRFSTSCWAQATSSASAWPTNRRSVRWPLREYRVQFRVKLRTSWESSWKGALNCANFSNAEKTCAKIHSNCFTWTRMWFSFPSLAKRTADRMDANRYRRTNTQTFCYYSAYRAWLIKQRQFLESPNGPSHTETHRLIWQMVYMTLIILPITSSVILSDMHCRAPSFSLKKSFKQLFI